MKLIQFRNLFQLTYPLQQYINGIKKIYPNNDKKYFFKSCQKNWMVILEKTKDTKTNQTRLPSDSPFRPFAKFRANELAVVNIINKFNPSESINEITSSISLSTSPTHAKTIYIKGQIVYSDKFDSDLSNVYTNGIHFYEDITAPFYYELRRDRCFTWYNDGQRWLDISYLNGEKHGKFIEWFENGKKKFDIEFKNGLKHGKFYRWYESGQKFQESTYDNGKRIGKHIFWHENGTKHVDIYKNGIFSHKEI